MGRWPAPASARRDPGWVGGHRRIHFMCGAVSHPPRQKNRTQEAAALDSTTHHTAAALGRGGGATRQCAVLATLPSLTDCTDWRREAAWPGPEGDSAWAGHGISVRRAVFRATQSKHLKLLRQSELTVAGGRKAKATPDLLTPVAAGVRFSRPHICSIFAISLLAQYCISGVKSAPDRDPGPQIRLLLTGPRRSNLLLTGLVSLVCS